MPRATKPLPEPEIVQVKPWPENGAEPFAIRFPKVLTTSFRTPQQMYAACDKIQVFAHLSGFSESRSVDIAMATSEALENARKAMQNYGKRGRIHVTAIANPGKAILIFVEDTAGMMGAARMKFSTLHEPMAEHGRGSFIMATLSNFLAIIGAPGGKRKDIALGFYA
mgnify:CR=1 FL=1